MSAISMIDSARTARLDNETEIISDLFEEYTENSYLGEKTRAHTRMFIDCLGFDFVKSAMFDSCEKFSGDGLDIIKYFYGTCFRKASDLIA